MKPLKTNIVLFVLVLMSFFMTSCSRGRQYMSITGYAQGGTYSVVLNLWGEDGRVSTTPQRMKTVIDSLLNVIDYSVSGYNKNSLLTKFNAGEEIVPDDVFIDLYDMSREYWEMTGEVLDVASAPLFDMWGFGFTSDSLPSPEAVANTLADCGMKRLPEKLEVGADGRLSPAALVGGAAVLPRLNFNAVAQGYSCDRIAEYLYSVGIKDMMIDVGGEIYCDGLNPSGLNWSLGIDRPEDGNNVPGAKLQGIFRSPGGPCGIVTSGNYRKFYVKDGKKYSHTIDPRTGWPVSHSMLSATVIAADATLADGLATAFMVMGLDEASKFIESLDGVEACLVYDEDGAFKTWTSSGFTLEEVPTSR